MSDLSGAGGMYSISNGNAAQDSSSQEAAGDRARTSLCCGAQARQSVPDESSRRHVGVSHVRRPPEGIIQKSWRLQTHHYAPPARCERL